MKSQTTLAAFTFACLIGAGALAGCGPSNNNAASNGNTPAGQNAANTNGSNQPGSDTWITTKVKGELATTGGVHSTDISVKTVNGVVTLTGNVPTDTEVKKAVAAARSVKGVKDVDSSGLKSSQ
jgi:hyperosmotically inducible protein